MSTLALVKRHPATAYFVLTFAISWGGVLAVIAPEGIPGTKEQFETLLPIAIITMLAGPITAGILLTGLVHGRAGFRDLWSRLLRWRVGVQWYAVALLAAPLIMMAVLLALSPSSSKFIPDIFSSDDKATRVLAGIATGLAAGLLEEIGWTGFATPELLRRHGVTATGLIVGVLWAAWHLLVGYWASGTVSGTFAVASYLLDPLLFLVAFRVFMVWVYNRTGSLMVAMLMHASLTGSSRILAAPAAAAGGMPLLASDILWTVAVSLVVVIARHYGSRNRRADAG